MPTFAPLVRRMAAFCCLAGMLVLLSFAPRVIAADNLEAISGNISPLVVKGVAQRVSAPAETPTIRLVVTLTPRNSSAFDARVAAMSNASSPYYRVAVSPVEFALNYAPDAALYNQLVDYLASSGFTITGKAANRLSINVSGSFAAVSNAFHTTLSYYAAPNGRTSYSNTDLPKLPATFAHAVQAIVGLDNLFEYHTAHSALTPAVVSSPASGAKPATCTPITFGNGYSAQNMESGYNLDGLYPLGGGSGFDGSGQTIAATLWDTYNAGNFNKFVADNCLPAGNISTVNVGAAPPVDQNVRIESDLDVQQMRAAAPRAAIKYYTATTANDSDLLATLTVAANDTSLTAISNSWGACEALIDSTTLNAYHTVFQVANSNNIAVLVSSGDSGIYECQNEHSNSPAPGAEGNVNSPASDSAATAVGGTNLQLTASNPRRWQGETGWSCDQPPANQTNCYQSGTNGSSGGGISSHTAQPSYQSGVVPGSISSTKRTTPDISADGDGASEMEVFVGSPGGYHKVGGTSAASPWLAGLLALASDKNAQKPGFLNTFLYTNFSGGAWSNDETVGYNGTLSTAGYDLVTGLGSVKDGTALAAALSPAPSLQLRAESPTSADCINLAACVPGNSVQISYTLNNTMSTTATGITLSAALPADNALICNACNVTISGDGASGLTTGTTPATLITAGSLDAGKTATISFVVKVAPTYTGGTTSIGESVIATLNSDGASAKQVTAQVGVVEPSAPAATANSLTLSLRATPDLALAPGGTLSLDLLLNNTTGAALSNVHVVVAIPSAIKSNPTLTTLTGLGTITGKTTATKVTVTIASLPAGHSTSTLTIVSAATTTKKNAIAAFKGTATAAKKDNAGLKASITAKSNTLSLSFATPPVDDGLGGSVQKLTVKPATLTVGLKAKATVSGSGFTPKETLAYYLVAPDGTVSALAAPKNPVVGSSGKFSYSLNLAFQPAGTYTVLIVGGNSKIVGVGHVVLTS